MAGKVQTRLDTADNFAAENTLLLDGELARESDTGKLKMGDGVTAWNDLEYFFSDHLDATSNVHGIADTSLLETQAGAQAKADAVDAALIDHLADTTAVHGIANTSLLETTAGAQAKADAAVATVVGTVFYGSDPDVARPSNANPVLWIGHTDVVPNNATENYDVIETFDPPLLTTLDWYVDLDASTISGVTDGVTLETWTDSDAGLSATQPQGSKRPFYRATGFNGGPAVEFDTGRWMECSFGETLAQPRTVIVVGQYDTVPTSGYFVDGLTVSTRSVVGVANSQHLMSAGTNLYSGAASPDTQRRAFVARFSGGASKLSIAADEIAVGDAGTHGLDGLKLGAGHNGTTAPLVGKIVRVLVLERLLTDAEVTRIYTELDDLYAVV